MSTIYNSYNIFGTNENKSGANDDISTISNKVDVLKNEFTNSLTKEERTIAFLLNKIPALRQRYHLYRKIGEGTFSSVYLAKKRLDDDDHLFAVKHLVPTSNPQRIHNEINFMQIAGVMTVRNIEPKNMLNAGIGVVLGQDNVVGIECFFQVEDYVVIIMPYFENQRFQTYMMEMSAEEVQCYMQNLLKALQRVHSFGIIHRDVKPSNFLYNRTKRKFLLVDFGLAEQVKEPQAKVSVENSGPKENRSLCKRKRSFDEVASLCWTKRPALAARDTNTELQPAFKRPTSTETKRVHQDKRPPSQPTSKCHAFQSLLVDRSPGGSSHVRVHNSRVVVKGKYHNAPSVLPVACNAALPARMDPHKKPHCGCDGRPQICNWCIVRRQQAANRAGTPGFRPPEVLLKFPLQTTAVDIWAAGVMFLCLLSRSYPFFRSPDDMTALGEQFCVFGTKNIQDVARKLGRNVVTCEERPPLCLQSLCERLWGRQNPSPPSIECPYCRVYGCLCPDSQPPAAQPAYPNEAYDLLRRLLDPDPTSRISAPDALRHPFFTLSL